MDGQRLADGVLHTRLVPPGLPKDALERERLLTRVRGALDAGSVSVVAGAGYGKTTLLAQAAARSDAPVVWLTCDERLSSAAAVIAHLVAGFGRIVPGFGAGFPPDPSEEATLVRFLNELALCVAEDVLLVVDDVHSLPSEALAALRRVARDAPAQVHLGLAGRRDSPLTRADIKSRRHLTIGEPELCLTPQESAELLARAGLVTDAATLSELSERTEGWVSGLLLGAQAGHPLERALGAPRSEVFSLLADEVFESQTARMQRFLLATSVLDRFTPAIAAEVAGVPDAETLTAELVGRHLFCSPLDGDDEATWYRYHQLLRDYLRLRLGVRSPERRALHHRAGAALARRGLHSEAIGHYIAAREHALALDLLDAHAERLSRGPQASELLDWLSSIPREEWWSRPAIVAARAARLLVEELDYDTATEEAHASVERLLVLQEHERAAFLLAKIGQTRIMGGLGRRSGLERTAQLLERVSTDSVFLPVARMAVAGGHGWLCEFERAENELAAALRHPAARDSPICHSYAEIIRAHLIDRVRGDVVDVPRRLDAAITTLEHRPGEDELAFVFYASTYRAFALSYLGRHAEVFEELARFERLARERGHDRIVGFAEGWLRATAFADQARWEELGDELARIEQTGDALGSSAMTYYLSAFRAQLAASRGQVAEVAQQIALSEWQMEETIGGPDFTALCDLSHAAHIGGLVDEARRLSALAREVASGAGAAWGQARACLLVAHVLGNELGDEALDEGLAVSAERRFEDLWVYKERRVVGPLLARALQADLGPAGYARRLVALCGGEILEHLLSSRGRAFRSAGSLVESASLERATLSIRVLGPFSVRRGTDIVPVAAFGRARARALLALLCAHPEGLAKDQILEWLWPDLPPDRGARALNTTLHALRRATEPHLSNRARGSRITLRSGRCRLSLESDDALDVTEFLDAATKARSAPPEAQEKALRAAESRYAGEAFVDWRYEPWAEGPRERVALAREEVLRSLAECLLVCGDARGSAERYGALVEDDPLREEWHRGVMRARWAAGEAALALRQFHECRTRLREELGMEPGEETRALYQTILTEGERVGAPGAEIDAGARRRRLPEGTVTIMLADIADSTGLTERLGDAAFRSLARALDGSVRRIVVETGGVPVEGRLLGDGLMAVFTSGRQAIECGMRTSAAAAEVGLALHVGLHAGDVVREGDNVFGGAVNIAARVAALAPPGEVFVSETVRSLARTSAAVAFESRGAHTLKGVEGRHHLYAIRPELSQPPDP